MRFIPFSILPSFRHLPRRRRRQEKVSRYQVSFVRCSYDDDGYIGFVHFGEVNKANLIRVHVQIAGGKRSKVLWITLGVLAATLGLIAAIWLWKSNFFYRRKHWERFSRPKGPD